MASAQKINGRTEEELRALFRANAQKAREFVYMSDSDPYESEVDYGFRTPESLTFSPQPQLSLADTSPSKPTSQTSTKGCPNGVRKPKWASGRYPRTRSQPCDHVWLDSRRKNFVNYKPYLGSLIRCSINTYMREHDPENQHELWGHLTPAQRREREYRKWRAGRPCPSYTILPDGTFKTLPPQD